MRKSHLPLGVFIQAVVVPFSQAASFACSTGFTVCSPSGALSTGDVPQIGDPEFVSLFSDIVLSSLPPSKSKPRWASEVENGASALCCTSSLSCLTLHGLLLPFCYDPFTTNFYLPDSSYGTVVGGAYTSSNGSTANLESGDYALTGGQTGNIYSADEAQKPNTNSLPMPTQYTASGVGTPVPASILGGVTVTYTTTLPGSTTFPTTVLETVVRPEPTQISIEVQSSVMVQGSWSTMTTNVVSTVMTQRTEVSGTTVLGTTVGAKVTTVTSVMPASASASAAVSASTSDAAKSALNGIMGNGLLWVGLVLVLFL